MKAKLTSHDRFNPWKARYQFSKQVHKHNNKILRENSSVKKCPTYPGCPTIHALMFPSDAEILL